MKLRRHIIEVGSRKIGTYIKLLKKNKDIVLEVYEPLQIKADILEYHINKLPYEEKKRCILNRTALSDKYKRMAVYYIIHPLEYSSLEKLDIRGVLWWNQQSVNVKNQLFLMNTCYVKTKRLVDCLFNHRADYEYLKVKPTIDSLNINTKGNVLDILKCLTNDYKKNIDMIRVNIIDVKYDIYENQTELYEIVDLLQDFFELYKKIDYPSKKEQKLIFVNKRLL